MPYLDSDLHSDYSPACQALITFLSNSQWKEADRASKDWLDSCSDELEVWLLLDDLWTTFSNGHFGFSIQQEIWVEMGLYQMDLRSETYGPDGNDDANDEDCFRDSYGELKQRFRERLGWCCSDSVLSDKLNFSLDSPPGHLPSYCRYGDYGHLRYLTEERKEAERLGVSVQFVRLHEVSVRSRLQGRAEVVREFEDLRFRAMTPAERLGITEEEFQQRKALEAAELGAFRRGDLSNAKGKDQYGESRFSFGQKVICLVEAGHYAGKEGIVTRAVNCRYVEVQFKYGDSTIQSDRMFKLASDHE
jgi:hypothetical protein